jgi:hypothetical protein
MSKRNAGKRQGGVVQRFANWLAGTPPPSEENALIQTGGNEISQWPASYDDTKLEGSPVIGGKVCRTPGQVKAATAKKYDVVGYGPADLD